MKRKTKAEEETGVEGRTREKLLIYQVEAVKGRENIALNHWLKAENDVCTFSA